MSEQTLMVIDDEAEFGHFVADVARHAGYRTIFADGFSSFSRQFSRNLDIVVLDLMMPEIDGIELIRFLAENNSKASLILMSGFDDSVLQAANDVASGYGLNVLGRLTKPFEIEELENLLKKAGTKPHVALSGEDQIVTEDELANAIHTKELCVFYQPQVRFADRVLVGVEALVRWRHPVRGLLSPNLFVPVAENCGLIYDLTQFVIMSTLAQCAQWKMAGINLRASINLSARTLGRLDIPEQLVTTAARLGLEPSQVVLEVTETSIMAGGSQSLDILTRLRMKGFGLSIDDFGTGVSSLQRLRNIPFTELKIDLGFVQKMGSERDSRAIVESIIDLGHKVGMIVVAEGVETQLQWDLLTDMGCDVAQGYLIGKPMPFSDFTDWIENWN